MGATTAWSHHVINCTEIKFHPTSFPSQIAITTASVQSLKKEFKSLQERKKEKSEVVMSEIPLN